MVIRVDRHTRGRIVSVSVHGVVSRLQLFALGLTRGQIDALQAAGTLWPLFPGVYAVGRPQVTQEGWWLAAVLACGEGAQLSHQDAAALRGLRRKSSGRIHVTVPRVGTQRASGLQIHLSRTLHPDDLDVVDGVPCTGPERTLLDLCDTAPLGDVERAVEVAYRDRLLRVEHLHRQRYAPGRRCRKLERALRVEVSRARSPDERAFLRLVAAAGLPKPLCNVWVPEFQVELDALWPDHRLAVEVDSRFHDTPHARERDARKDRLVSGSGIDVLRVRRPQFPTFIASELAARLTRG
jgi:hypothetical protein